MRNRSGCGNGGSGFVLEALEERRVLSAAASFAVLSTTMRGEVHPISVAVDTHGNTLVLGSFADDVDFDPRRTHEKLLQTDDFLSPDSSLRNIRRQARHCG